MKEEMAMGPSQKKMYPHVSFSIKDLPEAKNWDIGQTYKVELTITQTGLSIHEGSDGRAEFDIKAVRVTDNPGHKNKEKLMSSDGYLKR